MNSKEHPADFASRWVGVQSRVSAYIRSAVRDAHHQEDMLQNVARLAFEQFDRFDPSRSFLYWVLGITRNLILQYYQASRQDRLVFSEHTLGCIEKAYSEMQGNDSIQREALSRCISKLEEHPRHCINMRYSDGLAVKDIAEQLDKSANAISMLLFRARAALRQCVERELSEGASS